MKDLNRYYEISQGAGHMMYTLWLVICTPNAYKRTYIKNLSTEKDKALAAAEQYAQKAGFELQDDSDDNLRDIVRDGQKDTDGNLLVHFGKHKGKALISLPDGYVTWLAEGGKISVEENGYSYDKHLATEALQAAAKIIASERGLLEEFEGKLLPKRLIAWILNDRAGYGHHAAEGEKITLTLKEVKFRSFDTQYGTTYIVTYQDVFSGLKYEYKGGNPPSLDSTEEMLCKGTVKLGEYKDIKKTYLQRIKILNHEKAS